MTHQMRVSKKRAKASGADLVDEMTALQVAERAALTPRQLLSRVEAAAPAAVAGRRKVPTLLRRTVKIPAPQPWGAMTLGFLIDTIFNRDLFMHRVDITRATGQELALNAEHEGRIVAEIVGDWADLHDQPFGLVLEGPAGGSFDRGDGGQQLRLDAVEFCRIVSGRGGAESTGLLRTPVLF
jgi:uncharacterized protein (TIGR03083 family)